MSEAKIARLRQLLSDYEEVAGHWSYGAADRWKELNNAAREALPWLLDDLKARDKAIKRLTRWCRDARDRLTLVDQSPDVRRHDRGEVRQALRSLDRALADEKKGFDG